VRRKRRAVRGDLRWRAVTAPKPPINGIENFWNQAKRHMRKFNGVPKEQFPLFLKECEWRFNNPDPKSQLQQLKQWVREYMG
jgi:transposase